MPQRIKLAALPTPLVPAPRLAAAVGLSSLLIKRDDLTGFAIPGNKARALEFLTAAARRENCDVLVTGGSAGSNFCAAAVAAARVAGLRCHLVLASGPPPADPPGLALARSWGATVSWTLSDDRASVDEELPRVADNYTADGQRPYLLPRGGATALGAAGYALAAWELRDQLAAAGHRPGRIVVAVGSGCSLAGLIAGNVLLGRPWRLLGASVSRPASDTAARVLGLARGCATLLAGQDQAAGTVTEDDVDLVDARGPGFGLASDADRRTARTALDTEGLLVDPVYTAKALRVACGLAGERGVVFWHTGGLLDAVMAAQDGSQEERQR
ncbi:MAG TPA: pyridoxal-phosphate dependent enzyme [Streptosporangiaceae bacterium]|nr:pyridoxal-phosphate dependent enzyme [Streptosporangiaceae bacterium]